VILAPGSITARPPIPGLELPGVITSAEALNIDFVPERLIVVGGGVIGLEFACIYEALGSHVTILEMMPTILPGAADEAIAKRLALGLRRRGMAIHTGATVQAIEPSECGLRVTLRDAKGPNTIEGERVLVAVGRWPNTEGHRVRRPGRR
jgi:dihydrolipoamide dehydrogenase